MIILNFAHPLTDSQIKQIESNLNIKIKAVKEVHVQFNHDEPFEPQIRKLILEIGFSPYEWQTEPILIVPPSLNTIAVALLSALHGLMGYFPPIIRLKPVKDAIPPRFEVAEIINLQNIREKFRALRNSNFEDI